MGIFERYLTVWVFLCIATGIGVLVHRIFAIEIGRPLAEKSWH